jgi:oxygen-independent coproporphyrinogen-3 oxidase
MEQPSLDQFFRSAPAEIDAEAIRREWLALKPPYQVDDRRLPLPVWARRDFTETGEQAWAVLSQDVSRIELTRPFCIYVHIPFCASRCSFCDCYSFALRRHRTRHIERYLALLAQEMRLWSQLGTLARRPVMFSSLDDLGFTRLHIGVQSLEDHVRRIISRREPAAAVLEKIARAAAMGWVVSVDLILGLPGQTPEGVLDDIKALEAAGVEGFSLYELQLSSRNRRFAERHGMVGQERLVNYLLLQTASRQIASLGYRKTLFNHFAREHDTNLYFTFPERGEDCLALGTIADGVFSDYHYRHPEYKAYSQGVDEAFPGLQGGLRRNALENRLYPLEIALLSASIPPELFADVLGSDRSEPLLRRWREATLVEDGPHSGRLRLTTNGSWFISKMMAELSAQ